MINLNDFEIQGADGHWYLGYQAILKNYTIRLERCDEGFEIKVFRKNGTLLVSRKTASTRKNEELSLEQAKTILAELETTYSLA